MSKKRNIVVCGSSPSNIQGSQNTTCMACDAKVSASPTSFRMILERALVLCIPCALKQSVRSRTPMEITVLPGQIDELRRAVGEDVDPCAIQDMATGFEALSRALIAKDVKR